MRNTIITILFLFNTAFAQVKNGEFIPGISFKTILNAPVKQSSLDALKGKVLVLDFWATWCSPCIAAMPHLEDLQKRYPDKLRVITLTEESVKRITQFIAARPSNLWFGVDSGGVVAAIFPHKFIPHTLLISTTGHLLAATEPENITASVIDSILSGQTVHLPPKVDNLTSAEDILKAYFHADDSVQNRLIIQPEIKGAGGVSTTYLDNPAFSGRRITAINLSPLSLYQLAYGDFPYGRTVNRLPKGEKTPSYCLDIIVPQKGDLLPALQKELLKRFEVKAKIEPQPRDVYVLKIADANKFKALTVNTSGTPTYFSRQGEVDRQAMTMADLADYLENYALNIPVVDVTGNTEKFDIKFSFQPEKPQTLKDALISMGLALSHEKRKIDMLVLYKDAQ